jgi:hypothetical protein
MFKINLFNRRLIVEKVVIFLRSITSNVLKIQISPLFSTGKTNGSITLKQVSIKTIHKKASQNEKQKKHR